MYLKNMLNSKFVFNIIDNVEIIATIVLPRAESSWKVVDFCDHFVDVWTNVKNNNQTDAEKYIKLSQDLKLRAIECCSFCGGYQTIMDKEYMEDNYPIVINQYDSIINQSSPYITINPVLIKQLQNEDNLQCVFDFAEKKLFFKNVFNKYSSLDRLNHTLPKELTFEEIPILKIDFYKEIISSDKIHEFNDWIYISLQGFDLDDEPGNETWIFRHDDFFYKIRY